MAKVYRVLKMEQVSEGTFKLINATEWGAELGKARQIMNDMLDGIPDMQVVGLVAMDAPASREDFVSWLNKHNVSRKANSDDKNPCGLSFDRPGEAYTEKGIVDESESHLYNV